MVSVRTLVGAIALVAGATHASAADLRGQVVACEGLFNDAGQTSTETTLLRIGDRVVAVWAPERATWQRFLCHGWCATGARLVTVRDVYATADRGIVKHELAFDRGTGRLQEDWLVRDDLLSFSATCRPAADPAPDSVAVEPSTRLTGLSEHSVAYGLPRPIERRWFEWPLR